jgi:hypothetical protein
LEIIKNAEMEIAEMPDFDEGLTTTPRDFSIRMREVEARLRSHEDVCAERYTRLRDDHLQLRSDIALYRDYLGKRVDQVTSTIVKVAFALLIGMAGILAAQLFG